MKLCDMSAIRTTLRTLEDSEDGHGTGSDDVDNESEDEWTTLGFTT